VPASVTDKGDRYEITQPTGAVSVHFKPKAAAAHDPNVKVLLSDQQGAVPTTMPRSQALQVIKELPPEVRSLPVNLGLLKGAVSDMQAGRLTAPVAKEDMPVTKLDTPADVAAAYKAGKLTRAQAEKMLKEDFGIKE
jgi:RecB family endonuclease NucS